jgi:molecular chaperone HscB
MQLSSTDFELFGLPARFDLDRTDLDARWKALQGQVHPDRFAAQGAAAQRISMQWSVRVNEAYRRLKDPLSRAAYLCELNGVRIDAQSNTGMPSEFLFQQMQWREALEEAKGEAEVQALADEVVQSERSLLAGLSGALGRSDWPFAAQQVRALMFIRRFAHDVGERQDGA